MEQNNKYIEDLLEKFFDGLTSNKEEQILYRYFSEEYSIPEHLEKYRTMIRYFETDMEVELDGIFREESEAMVGVVKKRNTPPQKWIVGIVAVAASLLLLFLVVPFSNSDDFNPYEGSYVKKDGVFIYDRAEIEAERARIELLVEQKIACLDNPIEIAKAKLEEYEELEDQMKKMASQN